MDNLNLIIPEIFISISLMMLLMLGVFKKRSQKIVYNLSIIILIILLALILNLFYVNQTSIFNDSYIIDNLSIFMKSLTIIAGIFVLLTSTQYLNSMKIFKIE